MNEPVWPASFVNGKCPESNVLTSSRPFIKMPHRVWKFSNYILNYINQFFYYRISRSKTTFYFL